MIDLKTKNKSKDAFKAANKALVADIHTTGSTFLGYSFNNKKNIGVRMNKKNIFISGSISINELPIEATTKLDRIIEKGMNVLIGDAKGVDLQVQKYLLEKNYSNVIIYYTGKDIRNNIGSWKTKSVITNISMKNRMFYTEKDKVMVADTDYGLMIWDGKSKGTLNNIKNMRVAQKKFYVILKGAILTNKSIDVILNIDKTNSVPFVTNSLF